MKLEIWMTTADENKKKALRKLFDNLQGTKFQKNPNYLTVRVKIDTEEYNSTLIPKIMLNIIKLNIMYTVLRREYD